MREGPRLIVLGRQGAGKGTQCAMLAERLGVPHLSTGDLLRAETKAGTPLGRTAARYMDAGSLVPDDLVIDLVASRLGARDARARGYLLDGFPRTLHQGQALFEVLGADAADVAVEIDVPVEVALPRLAARRVCESCDVMASGDPTANGAARCHRCGGALVRRHDDNEDAIARRLAVFDEQSGPLLRWLAGEGLLVTVDGSGQPEEVHKRVMAGLRGRLPRALVDGDATAGGSR